VPSTQVQSWLEQSLPLLDKSTLPTTDDETIDAVPNVLQMERERVEAEKEYREEMGDGISTSTTDQGEDMTMRWITRSRSWFAKRLRPP